MWETAKFNTRLQVTELGLGNSATDASVWKTNYEYGELQTNGAVDGAKNTGNIARQTLSFDGLAQPFVVSYKYDSLYRLTEAVEKTGSTANWSQQFGYDRYGNRTGINQAIGSLTLNKTPAVDAATNRFTSGQGFVYDKNGNVVGDTDINSSLPRQFTFNGDNKQTEVKKDGVTVGRYFYDGEGKRIKKKTYAGGVLNEETVFVYDAAGKLVAEYSSEIASVNDAKVAYLTNDHLGSPRVITDAAGQVKSRRDYHPFGDEIGTLNGGSPHRTTALNYTTDSVRQKFTGYERDNETSLDYAKARMFGSGFGRFTSPDPLHASGRVKKPQTWNRYAYVLNNPLRFTDPSGLIEQGGTSIKHPDRRMVKINTADENIAVSITADLSPKPDPVTGNTGQRTYGEDKFFVFEINTRLTGEGGRGLDQSNYTTQTSSYNDDGTINSTTTTDVNTTTRTVTEDGNVVIAGGTRTVTENSTAVNENPEITVRQDGSQETSEDKNRVKINVRGVEKSIDYSVRTEGNDVRVVQDYDNKITIPGGPKFIDVPVNNKPDPIVESMRPRRNGLQLRGY